MSGREEMLRAWRETGVPPSRQRRYEVGGEALSLEEVMKRGLYGTVEAARIGDRCVGPASEGEGG